MAQYNFFVRFCFHLGRKDLIIPDEQLTKPSLASISLLVYRRLSIETHQNSSCVHDDVIKWKHFPRYWPFVRRIHRSPVNSPHKGQWRGALMFSLICTRINDWVNNREAGDLRRHQAHCDVIVMCSYISKDGPVACIAEVGKKTGQGR